MRDANNIIIMNGICIPPALHSLTYTVPTALWCTGQDAELHEYFFMRPFAVFAVDNVRSNSVELPCKECRMLHQSVHHNAIGTVHMLLNTPLTLNPHSTRSICDNM